MGRHESTASARNKGHRYTSKGLDSNATISPRHGHLSGPRIYTVDTFRLVIPRHGPRNGLHEVTRNAKHYVRRDVVSAEVADQIASMPRCAMDECDWTEAIDGLCAKHFSWGRRGSWATGDKANVY